MGAVVCLLAAIRRCHVFMSGGRDQILYFNLLDLKEEVDAIAPAGKPTGSATRCFMCCSSVRIYLSSFFPMFASYCSSLSSIVFTSFAPASLSLRLCYLSCSWSSSWFRSYAFFFFLFPCVSPPVFVSFLRFRFFFYSYGLRLTGGCRISSPTRSGRSWSSSKPTAATCSTPTAPTASVATTSLRTRSWCRSGPRRQSAPS